MLNDILTRDQPLWLPYRSEVSQFHDPVPSLTFIELKVVSMQNLKRVWHTSRERFRIPGSVLFRTSYYMYMLHTLRQVFKNLPGLFPTFNLEYPLLLSWLFHSEVHATFQLDLQAGMYQASLGITIEEILWRSHIRNHCKFTILCIPF